MKGVPTSSVVMPRLVCRDVAAEIESASTPSAPSSSAAARVRMAAAHALLTIGPAMIMIETEWPN